ncbi:hypothetical protein, partial [Paracidovorax cattleyae]|uniref:hypothetical protein n=1 Tax=Paracidovorax cattleyae TaxID=80868 RepID=UPI001E3B920D
MEASPPARAGLQTCGGARLAPVWLCCRLRRCGGRRGHGLGQGMRSGKIAALATQDRDGQTATGTG